MVVVMFVVGHQQFAHSAYKTKLSHELSTMETITYKLTIHSPYTFSCDASHPKVWSTSHWQLLT
jgi:hypothetical protein